MTTEVRPRFTMPHAAIVCEGAQLERVISELEAGTYPQPDDAIWRGDLPHALAVRLAKATGATDEQIAEITAADAQEATAEPAQEDAGEPAEPAQEATRGTITISHDHENGTLVHGSAKGDGVYEALKASAFGTSWKYFPSIRKIGIRQSRDNLAKRYVIERGADAVRALGFAVTVEIDDTPRDVAEVKADRAERLDARYEGLSSAAERNAREAASRFAAADHYSQRFAGGQPILVGHHSERGARVAQRRIDQNMTAGTAAQRNAERIARAAEVVGVEEARRERPAVIIRRIDRLEAELRIVNHNIAGTRPANASRGWSLDRKPAEGDWLEQCQARKTYLEHQIAGDRAALAAHEAAGYVIHSKTTIHKGDRVTWRAVIAGRPAESATVTRTNPKSVTLDRDRWPRLLSYEQITSVECPHETLEGDTGTMRQKPAQPLPRRPKPAVTVEAPTPPPAPLEISARSEFFPTPAAVVARMIAAADLSPGMEVLEPSAGNGAIASAVHALGCLVDCVEQCADLAAFLADDSGPPSDQVADPIRKYQGCYRYVRCADFMECEPGDPWGVGVTTYYDRVMMNPPFSRGQDVRHVYRAYRFLRAGGLLVAVMPAGVRFRADRASFREFVSLRGGTITDLPADAFAQSGTNISTVLVTIPSARAS